MTNNRLPNVVCVNRGYLKGYLDILNEEQKEKVKKYGLDKVFLCFLHFKDFTYDEILNYMKDKSDVYALVDRRLPEPHNKYDWRLLTSFEIANEIMYSNTSNYFEKGSIMVEKTKGREIIGTFNPAGEEGVDLIKAKSAELIDLIEQYSKCPRRKEIAITGIEQAQMMAVKAIFS